MIFNQNKTKNNFPNKTKNKTKKLFPTKKTKQKQIKTTKKNKNNKKKQQKNNKKKTKTTTKKNKKKQKKFLTVYMMPFPVALTMLKDSCHMRVYKFGRLTSGLQICALTVMEMGWGWVCTWKAFMIPGGGGVEMLDGFLKGCWCFFGGFLVVFWGVVGDFWGDFWWFFGGMLVVFWGVFGGFLGDCLVDTKTANKQANNKTTNKQTTKQQTDKQQNNKQTNTKTTTKNKHLNNKQTNNKTTNRQTPKQQTTNRPVVSLDCKSMKMPKAPVAVASCCGLDVTLFP